MAVLEIIVLDRAKERVLRNVDVLRVKEQAVSQIEGNDKSKELFMAISRMRQNRKRGRKSLAGMNLRKIGVKV